MSVADNLGRFAGELRECRDDPVRFCERILEMDPHRGQKKWLKGSTKPENALVTGNRYGKSYVAAAKRIYKCAYRDGWSPTMRDAMDAKHEMYRSVNISFTAHQAQLVWQKAFALLQGRKISWLVESIKLTPFPTIVFRNGSRLEARSTAREGIYLLGERFDDVNWDEAAYETKFEYIRDNVIRMRTVDQAGSIDYTTTGNGRNEFGRFFLDGMSGKDKRLYCQTGTTYENPFVDQRRLKDTAARLSDRQRRQNVLGEIVDSGGEFFALEDLTACVDPALTALVHVKAVDNDDPTIPAWVELRFSRDQPWRLKYPSHRYVHGWDLADKRDWTVGTTWDLSHTPTALVEYERFNKRGWDTVYRQIRDRQRRYGGKTYLDTTGVGDVVVENLADIGAGGINFGGGRKDELLSNLQMMINGRELAYPMITQFFDEHKFYERDDDGLVKDCVMSAAVAAWFMRRAESASPFGVYVPGRRV